MERMKQEMEKPVLSPKFDENRFAAVAFFWNV